MPQSVIAPRRVNFQTVALLTDLEPGSERMLRFAASLARSYESELVVAHAFAPEFGIDIPPEPLPNWPAGDIAPREDAEEKVRDLISRSKSQDVVSATVITESHIPALLQELEERRPDLVIVRTHGRKGLRKLLSGSVSEEVFRRAKWPVLVVPPQYLDSSPREMAFEKIVFATDLSEVSATAARFAAGIACDHEGTLTTLYVDVDSGRGFASDQVGDLQRLEEWLRSHGQVGFTLNHAEFVVRFGHPAIEILDLARETQADLVVLGARGRRVLSGVASHFLGGTSYAVACDAQCPVLIVPHKL